MNDVLKRMAPLSAVLGVIVLFFVFDLGQFVSFDALREHRIWLLDQIERYVVMAPLLYLSLYIVVVAFSLPGGLVMTLAGGFLFGAVMGGLYVVVAATIGATALFLIAKTSLGDFLLKKVGGSLQRMQQGFAENALSYMFVLRLVPIFPFFLVNLAPAFLGVPLRTYVIATFFGIMPGTFVFALAGSGLGSVFDRGEEFSLAAILTPEMMGALVGLALLALVPVIYKHVKTSKDVGGTA